MEKINNGGQAFPRAGSSGDQCYGKQAGMSLRQYYAGQALNGLLSGERFSLQDRVNVADAYARTAVKMADALIAELEKTA